MNRKEYNFRRELAYAKKWARERKASRLSLGGYFAGALVSLAAALTIPDSARASGKNIPLSHPYAFALETVGLAMMINGIAFPTLFGRYNRGEYDREITQLELDRSGT